MTEQTNNRASRATQTRENTARKRGRGLPRQC